MVLEPKLSLQSCMTQYPRGPRAQVRMGVQALSRGRVTSVTCLSILSPGGYGSFLTLSSVHCKGIQECVKLKDVCLRMCAYMLTGGIWCACVRVGFGHLSGEMVPFHDL